MAKGPRSETSRANVSSRRHADVFSCSPGATGSHMTHSTRWENRKSFHTTSCSCDPHDTSVTFRFSDRSRDVILTSLASPAYFSGSRLKHPVCPFTIKDQHTFVTSPPRHHQTCLPVPAGRASSMRVRVSAGIQAVRRSQRERALGVSARPERERQQQQQARAHPADRSGDRSKSGFLIRARSRPPSPWRSKEKFSRSPSGRLDPSSGSRSKHTARAGRLPLLRSGFRSGSRLRWSSVRIQFDPVKVPSELLSSDKEENVATD